MNTFIYLTPPFYSGNQWIMNFRQYASLFHFLEFSKYDASLKGIFFKERNG